MHSFAFILSTLLVLFPVSSRALIIDGLPAKPHEWGKVVGITAVDPLNGLRERIVCSGVLIHPKIVLTAAHCLLPETKSVYIGSGIDGGLINGQHEIERVERYPGWTGYTEHAASYDFAFIQLKKSVLGVTPARIFRGQRKDHKNLIVIGFGARDSKYLLTGEKYFKEMPFTFNERLKTIFLGSVLLPGDSGGPGFVDSVSGPELIGINSRIIKRTSVLEVVDENVSCWIEERTGFSLDDSIKPNCDQWNLRRKNFVNRFKKIDQSFVSIRNFFENLKSAPTTLTFRRGLLKMDVTLILEENSFKLESKNGLNCNGKMTFMLAEPFYPILKGVCDNHEAYIELESVSNGRLFLGNSKRVWKLN